MDKIGIIRFSALGDIASTIPVVRACKSPPVCITSPLGKALYQGECEEFIVLQDKSVRKTLRLLTDLWRSRLDAIVDLQSNDRSKAITALSLVSHVNSNGINQQQQTTKILADIAHKTDYFHALDVTPEVRARDYVVLNVGSSEKWLSKRLPDCKWREYSKVLQERVGLPFILTGSGEEREYVEHVARIIDGDCKIVAGKTSILELKQILKGAFLTVSTDSGPMHLSAVQKTPTIGLFGATNWIRSAPYGPWSVALFDKLYYPKGVPPMFSQLEVNPYYDGLRVEDGLNQLQEFLV